MKPPAPGKPLSSEELEQDAAEAGIPSDEAVEGGGDSHLPASESGELAREERRRPPLERALTELPPG